MKNKLVVKIQRSLYSDEGEMMLIYDEKRTVYGKLPLSKEVSHMLGNDLKGYFNAHLRRDGKLIIGRRVKNQNW